MSSSQSSLPVRPAGTSRKQSPKTSSQAGGAPPVQNGSNGRRVASPLAEDADLQIASPAIAARPHRAPAGIAAGTAVERPPFVPWLPEQDAEQEEAAIEVPEPPVELSRSWWARTAGYRGALLGLAAALVGGAGEALLFQEDKLAVGALTLLCAALLAMIAWSGVRAGAVSSPASRTRPRARSVSRRWLVALRLAGILASIGLWAASLWAFFANPDEIFGLQGQLWLAAMALFIVSCVRWYPRSGSALSARRDLGPPWTRLEVLILVGIVALSFIMRLAWLQDIPWTIDGDVYTSWREAQNFLHDPPLTSAFSTGYLGLGQPSLWFIIPAQFMKVFGTGLVGTRMGIAVAGSLVALPVYGIGRMNWGRTAAATGAFAMAVSASMIHMSRLSMPDMGTTLWWACAFYFLLRGLRSRNAGDFMWAGLIAGTSQYTHYGSRMLPFVLAAFFLYLALFHFRAFRAQLGQLGLVVAGFLIGAGPIAGYFVLHPEMWGSRASNGFLIPLAIPTTWEGWVHDWDVVWAKLQQNFLMFSVTPSRDFFYYASMLLPWEGVLLVLGAACLLCRWKQPAAFLVLLWGGSLLLLNSILEIPENPNPNLSHFRPAWAAFYLALAIPPALWLSSLRRVGRRAWQVGAALIGIGAIFLLVSNTYFYLVKYPPMQAVDRTGRTIQGRLYLETGPTDLVRVLASDGFGFDREYAKMLAPQTPAGEWFNRSRQSPLVDGTSNDQIFLYMPGDPYEAIIKYYYPAGTAVSLPRSDGQEGHRSYRVSAGQLQARYGATATFAKGGTQVWQGQVPYAGAAPTEVSLPYPVTATWSGLIYIAAGGEVQAQLAGAANAQIWLPGQTAPGGPTTVDTGWVPFVVQAELSGPASPQLMVQQAGNPAATVDTLHLWPQSPEMGLAVTMGQGAYPHRIDPYVGSVTSWPVSDPWDIYQEGSLNSDVATGVFNGPGLLGPKPVEHASIRWEGDLLADGGRYLMELNTGSDWGVRLSIDGKQVINRCGVQDAQHTGQVDSNGLVDLDPGWHHVQLDVIGGASNSGAQWIWTRPDGVREVVPPSHLRYTPAAGPGTSFAWPAAPEPVTCQP